MTAFNKFCTITFATSQSACNTNRPCIFILDKQTTSIYSTLSTVYIRLFFIHACNTHRPCIINVDKNTNKQPISIYNTLSTIYQAILSLFCLRPCFLPSIANGCPRESEEDTGNPDFTPTFVR